MDTVAARRLRPHERGALKRMTRQLSNAVNSRRGQIILHSRNGIRNRQIAEWVGITPLAVRKVIHRFNAEGIDGITWYPYHHAPCAPRRFTQDVVEQIGEIALSPPRELIGMSVWSLSKLRDYLIEQGVVDRISIEWLRQILRRCSIRWRHTKTWKESNDPEFQEKYRRIRSLYARRPANGIRLCVDEFGPLNLLPRHGRHYAKGGRVNRHRATYRRTQGVRHFLGVYDHEQDTLRGYFVKNKNRRTFLKFLRWIRSSYGDVRLHIVLDNVGYHSCPEILEYARLNNIRLVWTPRYASWLNRIECQFTAMKKFRLDNTDYPSHEAMQTAMRQYLKWRNGRRRITVTDWKAMRKSTRRRLAA